MTGWRHVDDEDGRCMVVVPTWGQQVTGCGCPTPTPDPASPCGYAISPTQRCSEPAGSCTHECPTRTHPEPHEPMVSCHTHIPTRRTCGHPIEATR